MINSARTFSSNLISCEVRISLILDKHVVASFGFSEFGKVNSITEQREWIGSMILLRKLQVKIKLTLLLNFSMKPLSAG